MPTAKNHFDQDTYYIKKGKRYYPIDGVGISSFPLGDGCWFVSGKGTSYRRISKLPIDNVDLRTVLESMHNDICRFLELYYRRMIEDSIVVEGDRMKYRFECNSDVAEAIIKFISMSEQERTDWLKSLGKEYKISYDGSGFTISADGMLVSSSDGQHFSRQIDKNRLRELRRKVFLEEMAFLDSLK